MGKWLTYPLGEIAVVGAGNSAPQDKQLFEGGLYPFMRTSDVGKVRFGTINTSADKLNDKGVEKLKRFPAGTILFPKSGASTFLNHRVMMECEGYVSSHLATIKGIPTKVLDKYLLFYLSTIKAQDLIQDHKYPSLKLPDIKGLDIPLPSIDEQQRIVAILDEAFAGIATATTNAKKNLQNARELFDSYLHSLSYANKPLGALVEIKTGKLNANAAVEGGEYPFFTCSREISKIDNYAFDCEAILLAGNNASGDFNVKHYRGKFNAYQRTYVITVKNDADLLYRYLYYQMLKGLKDLKVSSVGAGTKFLKLGMIQNFQIALPDVAVQKQIVEKLDRLSDETKRLEGIYQQKLEELADLQQSILQKAFAGELH